MSSEQRAARDAGAWPKGYMVLVEGLSTMRELNGRSGVVLSYDSAKARYEVQLADKKIRAKPSHLTLHPIQLQRERSGTGDEVVFVSDDAKAAREGTYAVSLDPSFWYDQALERVFNASNEFEVLDLPVEETDDFTLIKKQYRKISLSVHPDKNKHPQSDAAFRKVYGAFEVLSDPLQQRRLLFELGLSSSSGYVPTEKEKEAYAKAGGEDDDDVQFQWWWEASVPDVDKAAEEAEGADMDHYAQMWISDGLGDDVDDVRWIGLKKGMQLHDKGRAIFIDCREAADYKAGGLPGAWHVPMSAVMAYGLVEVMGRKLIHEILSSKRNALIIVYSEVATPFSRCRAMCRWLLRAGHQSLPAPRFRRLRGGVFGWRHRGGPIARPLTGPGGGAAGGEDELTQRLRDAAKRAERLKALEPDAVDVE